MLVASPLLLGDGVRAAPPVGPARCVSRGTSLDLRRALHAARDARDARDAREKWERCARLAPLMRPRRAAASRAVAPPTASRAEGRRARCRCCRPGGAPLGLTSSPSISPLPLLPTGGGAARWLRATTTPKIEAKIEAEVEAEVEAGDEAVPPWRLPLHPCRQRMQQRRVLPQRL